MRKAQPAYIPSAPPISPSGGAVVSPLDTTVSPPTTIIEQSQLQLSRPSTRKKTGSVVEEINRSLPPGIELYRSYRYQMPLMRITFDMDGLNFKLRPTVEPSRRKKLPTCATTWRILNGMLEAPRQGGALIHQLVGAGLR